MPLTLHLQEMTDSGIAVAALFVALWAPVVVLALLAGLLVDRLEARGVLLVASLIQAAIAAAMARRSTRRPRSSCSQPCSGSASRWPSRPSSRSSR